MMHLNESYQCPSCGHPSHINEPRKPLFTCENCGSEINQSMPTSKHNKQSQQNNGRIKPINLSLLLLILPLLVIILMVIFWLVFQDIREQSLITQLHSYKQNSLNVTSSGQFGVDFLNSGKG